jgi:hypothetical protein
VLTYNPADVFTLSDATAYVDNVTWGDAFTVSSFGNNFTLLKTDGFTVSDGQSVMGQYATADVFTVSDGKVLTPNFIKGDTFTLSDAEKAELDKVFGDSYVVSSLSPLEMKALFGDYFTVADGAVEDLTPGASTGRREYRKYLRRLY